MGVKSTKDVKKTEAFEYLSDRGITVYDNDCTERLQDMLNTYADSEYCNHQVWEEWEEDEYKGEWHEL